METLFPIAAAGLAVLALVGAARSLRRDGWPLLGWIGSAASAVVVASIWRADALPVSWISAKVIVNVWLLAMVVTGIGLAQARKAPRAVRGPATWMAAGALALNAAAFVAFFWMASVSGGGV